MLKIAKLLILLLFSVILLTCVVTKPSANDFADLESPVSTIHVIHVSTTSALPLKSILDATPNKLFTQLPKIALPTVTSLPTPTPAPTQQPDLYIFTNENEEKLDLSYGPIIIKFDNNTLNGIQISLSLVSPKNLGDFESTSEALSLGNGVAVSRIDRYGNLLINMHSGYYNNNPLEGEPLRFFLEGWGKYGSDFVLENLNRIIGSKGTISNDKVNLNIEVLGGVRLQHNEAEDLRLYPDLVIDIITRSEENKYLALGDPDIFEKIKKNSHSIMLSFCGWEPSEQIYYTYYRYVILLAAKEEIETPENIK